jgi:hypothetical protein
MGLAAHARRWYLQKARTLSMQAWLATGSVMPAQGSSARACAGGMHRSDSATAVAADTLKIALFMSSSFVTGRQRAPLTLCARQSNSVPMPGQNHCERRRRRGQGSQR